MKTYTNIGYFTPNLHLYNNQEGSPLLAKGKYSEKYEKKELDYDNSRLKANLLSNM